MGRARCRVRPFSFGLPTWPGRIEFVAKGAAGSALHQRLAAAEADFVAARSGDVNVGLANQQRAELGLAQPPEEFGKPATRPLTIPGSIRVYPPLYPLPIHRSRGQSYIQRSPNIPQLPTAAEGRIEQRVHRLFHSVIHRFDSRFSTRFPKVRRAGCWLISACGGLYTPRSPRCRMDQVMELRIKPRRLGIRHAENSRQKTGEST
jgi:hypothetical protein